MFNIYNRRPKEETLIKSIIHNKKWLLQFTAVTCLLVIAIFLYFYLTRDLPGEIFIFSEPENATILLNNKVAVQKTPAHFRRKKPGSYLIEVKMEGRTAKPFAKDVKVLPGSSVSVSFRLLTPEEAAKEPTVVPDTIRTVNRDEPPVVIPIQNPLDKTKKEIKSNRPSLSGSGRIFVSSNIPAASIFLNGVNTSQATDAILLVPVGTHQIQVVKEGYSTDPREVSVLIGEAFQEQKIYFRLTPENIISKKVVSVRTSPVEGPILIDNIQVGIGNWEGELKFGTYTLDFGNILGYIKPTPMKINVTSTDPSQTIVGKYSIGYTSELLIDESGQVIQTNIDRWSIGIHHPDVKGFVVDRSRGPKIVNVKHWEKFAWEFGGAFASKTPVGGQFLEFEFTIPLRTPHDVPLYLWIQAVKSTKNYPLTFVNRVHGVIEVNSKPLRTEWTPSRLWNTTDPEGWERHPLAERLVAGKNTIRIYSHNQNVRYFYVAAIRIGPQPETNQ